MLFDGSMVGRTAAVKKPYRDGSGNGIHAVGDRALEKCLDAYEAVLKDDAPVTDPDPLLTIRCAVNRKTEAGRPFCPEENISLQFYRRRSVTLGRIPFI